MTPTRCGASGSSSTRPIGATRSSPRAPRRAPRSLALPTTGRLWLRPFWDRLGELTADDRVALAHALVACVGGIGADWLPRLEAAQQAFAREGAVAYAVGCVLAERQLWGRARVGLQQAADDPLLPGATRRHAWRLLAQLAEQQGDENATVRCQAAAASIG